MGASGFVTLASHFTDRTVVTYDPRGADRSRRTDGAAETTPDEHADDLHRLIAALDAGPVDIFASSGGAVNALALVAKHPTGLDAGGARAARRPELPDRSGAGRVRGHPRDLPAQRLRPGHGQVHRAGQLPRRTVAESYADQPAPDPAMFGLPPRTTAPGTTLSSGRTSSPATPTSTISTRSAPGPTRVVIGVGATSGQMIAGRGGRAVAERLGQPPLPSPAATTGSSPANTAAWASPTPSPPPCTRSSTTNGRVARGVRPRPPAAPSAGRQARMITASSGLGQYVGGKLTIAGLRLR